MDTVLLIARLVLAAIFIVAGVAKLLDLPGSRTAMRGFGVPESAAGPAGLALPIVELGVAALLLPVTTAWWAALAGLLLLLAFIGGIVYNLARGRHPDCHCFGQLHSEPAGWPAVARNAVFSAIALFILIGGRDDPGHSFVGLVRDMSTAEILIGIIALVALAGVAIEGWLLVHLLGQNGRVLLRLDAMDEVIAAGGMADPEAAAEVIAAREEPKAGLPEGSPAPTFKLEGIFGETMTLDALRAAGKPVMLLFSDPGCGPCNALLPDIGKWQRDHGSRLTVSLVSRGTAEANQAKAREHGIANVLLQKDREVSNDYKAYGTPTAVIVRSDGTIGSPVAGGADAIRKLVERTTGTIAVAPAPVARPQAANGNGNGAAARPAAESKIGQPAPAFSLPDLTGKTVTLEEFKGQNTLVVFWNPGCGFCKRMTDELKAWEAKTPKGAPRVVLVSTGTVEANAEMGLTSTTVLDEGFQVGRSFGAGGTPSAVLVDKEGKIASDLAVGQPSVMALANGEDPKKVVAAAQNGAPARPAQLKRGEKAPEVELNDLDGAAFKLSGQKGKETVLVFWNPGCGYCRKMTDELKEWEASKPATAPEIVLVSTGTVEANRALALASRTLLDEGFATGRKFGASGTPSAVKIDKNGKVASEVAVGGPAVLALAGAETIRV